MQNCLYFMKFNLNVHLDLDVLNPELRSSYLDFKYKYSFFIVLYFKFCS